MKGKKVIVTSGFGFIGSRLIQALVDDNDVTIVDNGSAGKLRISTGTGLTCAKSRLSYAPR
jgi:nucleoside-diphosphate-sugar epimerase